MCCAEIDVRRCPFWNRSIGCVSFFCFFFLLRFCILHANCGEVGRALIRAVSSLAWNSALWSWASSPAANGRAKTPVGIVTRPAKRQQKRERCVGPRFVAFLCSTSSALKSRFKFVWQRVVIEQRFQTHFHCYCCRVQRGVKSNGDGDPNHPLKIHPAASTWWIIAFINCCTATWALHAMYCTLSNSFTLWLNSAV